MKSIELVSRERLSNTVRPIAGVAEDGGVWCLVFEMERVEVRPSNQDNKRDTLVSAEEEKNMNTSGNMVELVASCLRQRWSLTLCK